MTEQDRIVVLEDNHRLRAENDTLRRERDEARRDLQLFNDPRRWRDCFKKEEENP